MLRTRHRLIAAPCAAPKRRHRVLGAWQRRRSPRLTPCWKWIARRTKRCCPIARPRRSRRSMAAPVLAYENLGLVQGSGWLFRGSTCSSAARPAGADRAQRRGQDDPAEVPRRLIDTDEGRRTIQPGTKVVLLEQDPAVARFETLRDFALAGPDAPPAHEVDAIASQIGIDLDRPAAPQSAASGAAPRSPARWRRTRTCCCSTSRPTISISPRSNGWRIGSAATPAPSSRSATTAPS
jgi:hypothetical protein